MAATTLHTWAQRGPRAAEASGAALTMRAADGHRLTLTQNGVPVLLARPSADWFDLHVLALGNYRMVGSSRKSLTCEEALRFVP